MPSPSPASREPTRERPPSIKDAHRPARSAVWHRPTGVDRLALPIAVLLLLAAALPRLPPGICFDDPGDLQVASATLGIAHPPGYAGFVSLGYLLTWLPVVTPAYAVSLGCLAAGLAALALAALMQMRLGVNAWIAAALAVLVAGHPSVWTNLVLPEVYAPALAFEAAAAYLLCRHLHSGRRRDLWSAGLLLGLAFANRPPIGLALPAFVLALWLGKWRQGVKPRPILRALLLTGACFLLPSVYSAGYLLVRDTAANPYNYIERYRTESGILPPADAGVPAKVARLAWLASGQEFRPLLVNRPAAAVGRLPWLSERLASKRDALFVLGVIAAAFGLVLSNRRCPGCAVLLAGIALAAAAFAAVYRVYDTAADVLPILFSLTVLAGLAVSTLFPTRMGWRRRAAAMFIFIGVCGWTMLDARRRPDVVAEFDATAFVEAVDLPTLPRDAIILTSWVTSAPLHYARNIRAHRADVQIVTASRDRWIELARTGLRSGTLRPGPVYAVRRIAARPGVRLTRYRNLWRVELAPP